MITISCAKTTPTNIPYPPIKTHEFVLHDKMFCLDQDNADQYWLWKEEVKDYIRDVEKFR